MQDLAFKYQSQMLGRGVPGYLKKRARLAEHLECSESVAGFAIIYLQLGLIKATPKRLTLFEGQDGSTFLTLPIIVDDQIIDILAIDPENENEFYFREVGTRAIGSAAMESDTLGQGISLFETPLQWIRAWAEHWTETVDEICSGRPGPDLSVMDMTMGSPSFRGVCLLDPDAPLLPSLGNVVAIRCQDMRFATRITDCIVEEIGAEESRRRYPSISVITQ